MFPVQLVFVLAADTLTIDAWVPRRMAELHVVGVVAGVVTESRELWRWTSGLENVLTRKRADEGTAWPLRGFGLEQPRTASPHARIDAILPPGLIALAVWSALAWVVLIPLSISIRRSWRFGRWHEVLSLCLATPVAWVFLKGAAGPVLSTYFIGIAAGLMVTAFTLAALTWPTSRIAALLVLVAFGLLPWKARNLTLPLPATLEGGRQRGATLEELESLAIRALNADSQSRVRLGFEAEGRRWLAHDRSRGAEALLVLYPDRAFGVIAAANTGESTALLREMVDSIAR